MDNGTLLKSKKLTTPLARETAELILIKADIERCIEGFRLFGSVSPNKDDPKQAHAASSLFRDSVVSFIACFDSATPVHLHADDIYEGLQGGREYFRWLKDLRDTWIAHRFGPLRHAAYHFFVHPENGTIEGDGPIHVDYQMPSQEESKQLIRFSQMALDHAESLLSDRIEKLKAEAESLKPNQRLKLPDAGFRVPGPEHLRMGRRKYENITPKLKRGAGKPDESH